LINLRELSLHSNGLKDLKTIDDITQLKVLNVGKHDANIHTFTPALKPSSILLL
jgi:hypothetical protein